MSETETKTSKEIYNLVYKEIHSREEKLDEKLMKKLWLPADKVKKQFDEMIDSFEKYSKGVGENEKLFGLSKLFIVHLKELLK